MSPRSQFTHPHAHPYKGYGLTRSPVRSTKWEGGQQLRLLFIGYSKLVTTGILYPLEKKDITVSTAASLDSDPCLHHPPRASGRIVALCLSFLVGVFKGAIMMSGEEEDVRDVLVTCCHPSLSKPKPSAGESATAKP